MSNTARRKDAGQYEAAMTSPIADLDVRLDQATANEAEEAGTEIVRFDAEFGARMVTFSSMLLRSESTAIDDLVGFALRTDVLPPSSKLPWPMRSSRRSTRSRMAMAAPDAR